LRAKNDYTGAVAAFRQAAAMGNPYGEGSLGIMYEGGFGVPQSYQLAWQWYSKAANKGLPEAEKRLGQLYELGEGVPENWALALAWYQKSAALHDQEGEFALGRMYEFGMAVPQNRSLAIKWFQASANQGNSQGAYFARWLSVPSNNIGFRNNQEQAIVIKGRLPFVSGGDDPTGITFHNSAQRVAWLQGLRRRESAAEAHAMWQVNKDEYDKCTSSQGENCRNPGPPPRQ
jgi:TPR repeat protein